VTSINDDTAVLSELPIGPDDATEERADDLAEELARAEPKRWWNRGTVVLAAIVLLVGGFVGGLQAQKHWGTASTSGAASNPNRAGGYGGLGRSGYGGAFGGGQFPGGAQPGGAVAGGAVPGGAAPTATAAASATTGTVKLVDGTTVYVQTADGNVITVRTDGRTAVQVTQSGRLSDLTPGSTVSVDGASTGQDTVTATRVTKGG
jgi:hypothetical protein